MLNLQPDSLRKFSYGSRFKRHLMSILRKLTKLYLMEKWIRANKHSQVQTFFLATQIKLLSAILSVCWLFIKRQSCLPCSTFLYFSLSVPLLGNLDEYFTTRLPFINQNNHIDDGENWFLIKFIRIEWINDVLRW